MRALEPAESLCFGLSSARTANLPCRSYTGRWRLGSKRDPVRTTRMRLWAQILNGRYICKRADVSVGISGGEWRSCHEIGQSCATSKCTSSSQQDGMPLTHRESPRVFSRNHLVGAPRPSTDEHKQSSTVIFGAGPFTDAKAAFCRYVATDRVKDRHVLHGPSHATTRPSPAGTCRDFAPGNPGRGGKTERRANARSYSYRSYLSYFRVSCCLAQKQSSQSPRTKSRLQDTR